MANIPGDGNYSRADRPISDQHYPPSVFWPGQPGHYLQPGYGPQVESSPAFGASTYASQAQQLDHNPVASGLPPVNQWYGTRRIAPASALNSSTGPGSFQPNNLSNSMLAGPVRPRAKRRPQKAKYNDLEWARHQNKIKRLYLVEDKTAEETQEILEREDGFGPT
jgi:hypothetical protein